LSETVLPGTHPAKRQFRGAWLHTIGQHQYALMTADSMKRYFDHLLDSLQLAGINTILFQVRPEADAWFKSPYEPWSRYITGEQGKDPGWDPLAYIIEACHQRCLAIHAWINPYRVRTSAGKTLSPDHLYFHYPSMFIEYGDYLWFDPGMPANRDHIVKVVRDLVKRYDIDGIHMDDYFYPYPISGKTFQDDQTFLKYGLKKGFTAAQKADWRRANVNGLIEKLHQVIHQTKPWVQFGVSPFGIYRNDKTGVNGSQTNGFTNYDGLYADVLLWMEKGWIDYVIPQLYWEIGHPSADYKTLIHWWAANRKQVPLYIGQDVLRTMKLDSRGHCQLDEKMKLAEETGQVTGYCFWPGYELIKNTGGMVDSLKKNYFKYPAIPPANNPFDQKPPSSVRKLTLTLTLVDSESAAKKIGNKKSSLLTTLSWEAPIPLDEGDKNGWYVVYGYKKDEPIDLENPAHIVAITSKTNYVILPDNSYTLYVVTALDRSFNESKEVSIRL
jgi:uncharacterized lipoprotein YddW (UPF0748 family)